MGVYLDGERTLEMKRGAKMKLCRRCKNLFPSPRVNKGYYRLCEVCYEETHGAGRFSHAEELKFAR